MERRASQEGPIELIDSGQFLTAEEIFAERRTDDPLEMVVRAEVETYFGRLDKAADLLEQVAPRVSDLDVAGRYSLAAGRLCIWHGDYEQSNIHLQTAYYFYRFQTDPLGLSQSLIALALLDQIQRRFEDALAKLNQAHEEIKGRTSKKAEFVRGLIAAEHAAASASFGEMETSVSQYAEAARLLKATERGRYYARSLVGLAELKCALGEIQDSLELYKEANTIFERYYLKHELAYSQLSLARALLRLQRYERAEKLAEDSRNLRRGHPGDQCAALALLAVLTLKRNDTEQAAVHASAALDLSEQAGSPELRVRSSIAVGLVKLAEREFSQAAEFLQGAADMAGSQTTIPKPDYALASPLPEALELEATIYLAEAYHALDTRAGRTALVRASELLNRVDDAWLNDEYNRVSAKYEEQIVFTDDNRLVFDGNQLPKWQEAKRTLEGFLLRNALRQTNNSLTRAARKLGVSKVHVHNLKKKHNV